jgi:hypothetical protein
VHRCSLPFADLPLTGPFLRSERARCLVALRYCGVVFGIMSGFLWLRQVRFGILTFFWQVVLPPVVRFRVNPQLHNTQKKFLAGWGFGVRAAYFLFVVLIGAIL